MAKGKGKGGGGKKKKGEGGEKVKKMKAVTEGLALNEMSKKNLLKHIRLLFLEIDREREERNFFMLEREKHFLLWQMVLEQISQEKDRSHLLELQFDNAEAEKEKEMNDWKQKLRHLMDEQTEKLGQARYQNLYKMKRVQDEIWEIIMMLREGMLDKHREWRTAQQNKYSLLHMLQQSHTDEVTALREEFANEIKRMSETTSRQANAERKQIEARNAEELAVIRANKEEQIEYMLYMHEKQLLEMKTFFNDLEVNNLAVISSLQQEIAQKKLRERRMQRTLKETQEKYQGILVPLEQSEVKILEWNGDEMELIQIRRDIEAGQKQLNENEEYIRLMTLANDTLILKHGFVEKERNSLRDCFTKTVISCQNKGSLGRIVDGLRHRGSEAGYYSRALEPQQHFFTFPLLNNKDSDACRFFGPEFRKPPYCFNDCIFPDTTTEAICAEAERRARRRMSRRYDQCRRSSSFMELVCRDDRQSFLPRLTSQETTSLIHPHVNE